MITLLKDCFVDASRITVSTLPPTLETLRINSCEFVNTPTRESYFKTLNERMPQLKVRNGNGGMVKIKKPLREPYIV